MKQEERWVEKYLTTYRGFRDIKHEPDSTVCRVPPDFLLDGRIAVEVRRLNTHHETESGEMQAHEEFAVPRQIRLERLLEEFGPPTNGVSWYVSPTFWQPELTKGWEAVLRDKLQPFQKGEVHGAEGVIQIDEHFSLDLLRKTEGGSCSFTMGGIDAERSGCMVIPELEKNLNICIKEKTQKIEPYRAKYPEWWLVLVDFIMDGTQQPVKVQHNWDKVIVVCPDNFAGAYEVKSLI